nr:hypothetical protein [Tanacetum cinerariifolium]
MTSLTSLCELACQIVQKNLEEKQLEEEQAVKAQNWKLPVCYDDDDDEESSNSLEDNITSELPPYSAVTPSEPVESLSMGDEHFNTIPAMELDEFIKSCVENLVPNPSEPEGENKCDVPAGFTTFSNVLFDTDYDFDSDGNTGTLNIKMLSDVSDQKVPIPNLTITRILNQEKSPDLLSHQGFEAFQPSAECPMIINGKNIPLLDVPLFHFYPP